MMRENVCVLVGPLGVEALIVTCEFPSGVLANVLIVRVTTTGLPLVGVTALDG